MREGFNFHIKGVWKVWFNLNKKFKNEIMEDLRKELQKRSLISNLTRYLIWKFPKIWWKEKIWWNLLSLKKYDESTQLFKIDLLRKLSQIDIIWSLTPTLTMFFFCKFDKNTMEPNLRWSFLAKIYNGYFGKKSSIVDVWLRSK